MSLIRSSFSFILFIRHFIYFNSLKRDSLQELSIARLEYFLLGRVNLGRDSLLDSHRIECRSELSNRTVSESILLLIVILSFLNQLLQFFLPRLQRRREFRKTDRQLNQLYSNEIFDQEIFHYSF